jgi:hypothetical protein
LLDCCYRVLPHIHKTKISLNKQIVAESPS